MRLSTISLVCIVNAVNDSMLTVFDLFHAERDDVHIPYQLNSSSLTLVYGRGGGRWGGLKSRPRTGKTGRTKVPRQRRPPRKYYVTRPKRKPHKPPRKNGKHSKKATNRKSKKPVSVIPVGKRNRRGRFAKMNALEIAGDTTISTVGDSVATEYISELFLLRSEEYTRERTRIMGTPKALTECPAELKDEIGACEKPKWRGGVNVKDVPTSQCGPPSEFIDPFVVKKNKFRNSDIPIYWHCFDIITPKGQSISLGEITKSSLTKRTAEVRQHCVRFRTAVSNPSFPTEEVLDSSLELSCFETSSASNRQTSYLLSVEIDTGDEQELSVPVFVGEAPSERVVIIPVNAYTTTKPIEIKLLVEGVPVDTELTLLDAQSRAEYSGDDSAQVVLFTHGESATPAYVQRNVFGMEWLFAVCFEHPQKGPACTETMIRLPTTFFDTSVTVSIDFKKLSFRTN